MFNYIIANYDNIIFCWDWFRIWLFVVVTCSDLYVELVFFLFVSCIPFDILLSVEVESWMKSDEGSRIDLNKLLVF